MSFLLTIPDMRLCMEVGILLDALCHQSRMCSIYTVLVFLS